MCNVFVLDCEVNINVRMMTSDIKKTIEAVKAFNHSRKRGLISKFDIDLASDICDYKKDEKDEDIERCINNSPELKEYFRNDPLKLLSGGEYEIITFNDKPLVLGEGGNGVTYLATEKHTNRPVVVKLIKDEDEDLESVLKEYYFQRKANKLLTKGCKTPKVEGLMRLRASSDLQTSCFPFLLVQEFCSNLDGNLYTMSVDDALSEHKRGREVLTKYQWKRLCETLISAVQDLNEAGIYHLDIKPNNLMLQVNKDEELVLWLIDYGLSMAKGERVEDDSVLEALYISRYPQELYTFPHVFKYSDLYEVAYMIGEIAMVIGNYYLEEEMANYRLSRPVLRDDHDTLLANVRSLFSQSPGYLQMSLIEKAKTQPPLPLNSRVRMREEALEAVIKACPRVAASPYEACLLKAMIAVMCHTGLRICEITTSERNLQRNQIKIKDSSFNLTFTSPRYTLDEPATVNISSSYTVKLLKDFMKLRGPRKGALFVYPTSYTMSAAKFTSLLWSAAWEAKLHIRQLTRLSYQIKQ